LPLEKVFELPLKACIVQFWKTKIILLFSWIVDKAELTDVIVPDPYKVCWFPWQGLRLFIWLADLIKLFDYVMLEEADDLEVIFVVLKLGVEGC
jgi:hypothetical protein